MLQEKNKIFILVGASASGKTTVENKLIENGLVSRVVSSTSRGIRDSEEEGVDYYFKTPSEVTDIENVLEIHITPEWIYSVSKEEILRHSGKDMVYSCINIQPAEDMINYIKNNDIGVEPVLVFFDINVKQRIELLKARGETEKDISTRLSREDKIDNFSVDPDYIIKDIYTAYKEVCKIIKKYKPQPKTTNTCKSGYSPS